MEYLGRRENKLLDYTMRHNLLSVCQTLKHVGLSGPQNTHKWNGIALENARLNI